MEDLLYMDLSNKVMKNEINANILKSGKNVSNMLEIALQNVACHFESLQAPWNVPLQVCSIAASRPAFNRALSSRPDSAADAADAEDPDNLAALEGLLRSICTNTTRQTH